MEFRITHGPATLQNDLQFVKAGTLRVTPQAVEFSGKWQIVTPGKSTLWAFVMPLLFFAALTADHWVPQAWRTGIGGHIYETIKILIYISFTIGFLLQIRPFSKKIIASRKALREIARYGREVTFLLRDSKGSERRTLFNTDTEEEAAVIETALRDGDIERTFTITYGPAAPLPIRPVPGQIVIGPESVHLEGRVPRDPLPDRRRMRTIKLVSFIAAALAVLVPVIFTISSMSSGSDFQYPAVYFIISIMVMLLMIIISTVIYVRSMRIADVPKAEIADIRQQGEEVSFRAPLEGNHDVSGVTTIMQAGSPEQAAAIAQALTTRTEGSTLFTVNYGAQRDVNTFCLAGNGRLSVGQDAVRITGRRNVAKLSRGAGIGLLALMLVPFIIAFVLAWLAVRDMMLAMLLSLPTFLIAIIVSAWLSRVTIPLLDITGVERDGRQLTLHALIAGQEEQAVFHTRTAEEADAIIAALPGNAG